MPYKSIVITNPAAVYQQPARQRSQLYKGYSSLDNKNSSSKLFDIDLLKQDLLNHFNTRKGSRVMNPLFGSDIWDLLMEPLTPEIRSRLVKDVEKVCTSDPRIVPTQMDLVEYDNGFILELTLVVKDTKQTANMKLDFNQKLGIVG